LSKFLKYYLMNLIFQLRDL